MIDNHFSSEFDHPYKQSLMKSHNVNLNKREEEKKDYRVNDGGVFISSRKEMEGGWESGREREEGRDVRTI